MADVVLAKGRSMEDSVAQAAANIRRMGHYGRVLLKTDGEPALLDLRKAVAERLQSAVPMERSAPREPLEQWLC